LPVFAFPRVSLPQEENEEETYAISLVQTAEEDKEIVEVADKKVLAETYTVTKNDHVWQLLRERDLLSKHNLSEVLATLKELNRSLTNLDMIYPGQKIVIPLVITPLDGEPRVAEETIESPLEASREVAVSPEEIKDLDLENYTIKPDDALIRVINSRYDISEKELSDYLLLVKRLNPSIEDLNIVHPGQSVKLPVWSPQTVKVPILTPPPSSPPSSPGEKAQKPELAVLGQQLGEIFTQMGEEWIQTGDHFIPLQSGGHMNLKTESYPILNLVNGYKVIVDLHNELPENMARLIESNWETYRIIHLSKDDDLGMAFYRILSVCPYAKVYTLGEPLELGGDIPLRITGDWIIKPIPEPTDKNEKVAVITLLDEQTPKTPRTIKDYLGGLGIEVIDYPSGADDRPSSGGRTEILSPGENISSLVEIILRKTGQSFSRDVEIPIVKGGDTDFNLIIRADFFLKVRGKDAIVDLEGIGPDMIALLEEHQLKVLSLAGEEDPSSILRNTLEFLGIPLDSRAHDFMAAERGEQKDIRLTIRGIVFQDEEGQNILATHLNIPEEIALFLSQRGYQLLRLSSP